MNHQFNVTHTRMGILLVITLLALFCRRHALFESLWIDELHTSWTIQESIGDVIPRAAEGNQGPIYFLLQWLWIACVGESEFTLRLPSLIAGLLTPAAVYWSVTRIYQEASAHRVGLLAAALAATDDFAIFYAQEARPYAWVMLLAIWHFTRVVEWHRQPTRSLLVQIGVGVPLMFYTHYTTALLFLAEAVGVLVGWIWHRGKWQFNLRDLLLVAGIVALLLVPAFPQMRQLADRSPNWKQFVEIPTWSSLVWMFPGTLAVGVIWVSPVIQRWLRREEAKQAGLPSSMWWMLWLCVPLLFAWVCTHFDIARLYFPRYLLFALPASWILPSVAFNFVRDLREWSLGAALLLTCWVYYQTPLSDIWHPPAEGVRGEDWRGAIAWVNEQNVKGEPVYVDSGLIEKVRDDKPVLMGPEHVGKLVIPPPRDYLTLPVRGLYRLNIDPALIYDHELIQTRYYWCLTRGSYSMRGIPTFEEFSKHWNRIQHFRGVLVEYIFVPANDATPAPPASTPATPPNPTSR